MCVAIRQRQLSPNLKVKGKPTVGYRIPVVANISKMQHDLSLKLVGRLSLISATDRKLGRA